MVLHCLLELQHNCWFVLMRVVWIFPPAVTLKEKGQEHVLSWKVKRFVLFWNLNTKNQHGEWFNCLTLYVFSKYLNYSSFNKTFSLTLAWSVLSWSGSSISYSTSHISAVKTSKKRIFLVLTSQWQFYLLSLVAESLKVLRKSAASLNVKLSARVKDDFLKKTIVDFLMWRCIPAEGKGYALKFCSMATFRSHGFVTLSYNLF